VSRELLARVALRMLSSLHVRTILLLCLLLPLGTVWAQVPFDACQDRSGKVLPGVRDNTIPWAGVATVRNGTPVILWNQKTNQHLPYTEQIFIYLHECAHHTLGHTYASEYTPAVELEADCWAIQLMVDGGMIKYRHLAELEKSRVRVRADAYHLGGVAHIQSLTRCLEVRTDLKAWAAALDTLIRAAQDSFASSSGRVLDSTGTAVVYESAVGTPGTFDCEVTAGTLRCMVFASRKPKPAAERFDQLVKILRLWLPVGWTSMERPATPTTARSFLAQDGMTGTLLTLLDRGDRIYFLVKRTPV
jgi:hypothetical protein